MFKEQYEKRTKALEDIIDKENVRESRLEEVKTENLNLNNTLNEKNEEISTLKTEIEEFTQEKEQSIKKITEQSKRMSSLEDINNKLAKRFDVSQLAGSWVLYIMDNPDRSIDSSIIQLSIVDNNCYIETASFGRVLLGKIVDFFEGERSSNFVFNIKISPEIRNTETLFKNYQDLTFWLSYTKSKAKLVGLLNSSIKIQLVKGNNTTTPLNSNTRVTIGGQSNASFGAFYNSIDSEVYTFQVTRDTKSSEVDFLFFYGTTNSYCIAALDDIDAITAFNAAMSIKNGLSSILPTINRTRFLKTDLSSKEFDQIVNLDELLAFIKREEATKFDLTHINDLKESTVFAFMLSESRGSRIGLAKVVATLGTSGTNRAIALDVKIQGAI